DIGHIQKVSNWNDDQVSGFEILVKNFRDIDYMTYMVAGIAGTRIFEDGSGLRVTNIKEKHPQIFDWLGLIDKNVWIILGLMLIVASFNMISGLLIMILDRTNMIGVLKAIGTQNQSIQRIFLYQAAYLMVKGLFWGNLIGLSVCWFQDKFRIIKLEQSSYFIDYVPINLDILYLVLLNAGTLVLTMIILQLPAMVISRISPVKTIRYN
ncbi:MAG: ABC transporter permease, partial [Bacteroidales bacterium]|nr:ABC transporter permease [Bacteroidales bacterium]